MKKFFAKLYRKNTSNFYNVVDENLKNKIRMFIVTANPETFMHGINNKDFANLLLNKNTTLIPDGISIVKAARMLEYDVEERIQVLV